MMEPFCPIRVNDMTGPRVTIKRVEREYEHEQLGFRPFSLTNFKVVIRLVQSELYIA